MLLPTFDIRGSYGFLANAVNFDGTNDYLSRDDAYTGVVDGKLFTFAGWILTTPDSADHRIISDNIGTYNFGLNTSNNLQMIATDSGLTTRLNVSSSSLSSGVWQWVGLSFDLNNAANRSFYIGDTDASPTWTTYSNANLDFTRTNNYIGSTSASRYWDGDMAEIWVDFGTFIDFSVEANRRHFIDSSGNPTDLGSDGTGTGLSQPDIFLSGATATWHTNKGTAGGFTENGALTDASTSPSD